MDLTTKYLGMTLRTPLVPSASVLSEETDNIKKMEDAGASAVVLYSLFEEQIRFESREMDHYLSYHTDSFAEAASFFPQAHEFRIGPEGYLEHIRKAKATVDIPIIASLNGITVGGWTCYARLMQEAGADALELNIYYIPTRIDLTGSEVENSYVEIVRSVASNVDIPVAVKLSPYFSNMGNMAARLVEAGAKGLVLFNRFYQPDIDLEEIEVVPNVHLSTSTDIKLPMRWIAILYKRLEVDFAATSGVHQATDAIKLLMAGANVTMLCAALLKHGIGTIKTLETELAQWLEEHEYDSVQQMQGSLSQINSPDPTAFERAQYMRALKEYLLKHPEIG